MVSFEDIQNINLRAPKFKMPAIQLSDRLLILWIFVTCYCLSTGVTKIVPSTASLIGMYYALSDVFKYFYTKYIKSDDFTIKEADREVHYEFERTSDMMPLFQSGDHKVNTHCTSCDCQEIRDKKALEQLRNFEAFIRQQNLAKQESSRENTDDEYADMPGLVKMDAMESYTTSSSDLLSYMNPNLRQPGQYAASLNETGE